MTNGKIRRKTNRAQLPIKTRAFIQSRMKSRLLRPDLHPAPESINDDTARDSDASPTQYAEQRTEEQVRQLRARTLYRTRQAARYVADKLHTQRTQREEFPPAAPARARKATAAQPKYINPIKKKPPRMANTARKTASTTRTTAQTVQRLKQDLQVATRAAAKAAKATYRVIKEAVKAITAAVSKLASVIAAGGWVSVVILIVLLIVIAVLCSPIGIFYANETAEGQPMTEAIASINTAFYEEIWRQIDYVREVSTYDSFQVVYDGDLDGDSLVVNNWIDVLGVYAVLMTMDEQQATDVVTVTPDKIDALRRIFSEMNAVEYATETQTTQTEVEINGKTQVIEHINLTLHIYLTSLSYLQAADLYWFTAEERAMLHDLMRPEFVTLFANLLGTDPYGGTAPSVILNNLPANAKGSAIVQAALTKVGCKYVWGSRGPDTFDCSGFVYWCLKQAGISSADALRTSAAGQAQYCVERGWTISRDQLQPGDLIFWQNAACTKGDRWNEIHHTGIYIGDGKVIEASSSKGCVVIRNIWSSQSYPIAYLARIP